MPKSEVFNREIVLKNAMETFHVKGFNGTSMQDLVDATGLNRSSIYNSFTNKLNLYLECLNVYQNSFDKKTGQLPMDSLTPLEAIEALFNMYLNEIVSDKNGKGCMLVNCKSEMANKEASVTQYLLNHQKKTLSYLEALVSNGQDIGIINSQSSSESYAMYLFSSIQGLRMTGILINERKQLQSIIDNTLRVIK